MKKKISIPSLVLGDSHSAYNTQTELYLDQLSKVIPSLKNFKALDESSLFRSKTYVKQINDLKMIASATTSVYMNATEFKEISLMIPFYGENITTLDGKTLRWAAKAYAVLMPAVSRYGTSTKRSMLTIDLNPTRIFETAKTMLQSEKFQYADLKLYEPRLIPLSYGGFEFDNAIKKLCIYIDQYGSYEHLLKNLGIDEQFYRLIVMMLIPEKFFSDISLNFSGKSVDSKQAIQMLIEYSNSTSHLFYTLTDLENFTGLSSRVLQMGFKKHLGTTPTEWLRHQKIAYARHLILENKGYMGITAVAMECGFTNFSLFAKYYREQFGELPSETLQKVKVF